MEELDHIPNKKGFLSDDGVAKTMVLGLRLCRTQSRAPVAPCHALGARRHSAVSDEVDQEGQPNAPRAQSEEQVIVAARAAQEVR
jgi:hypothetical protein